MRSFTQNTSFKILALTASLMAVPFAGAYAAQSHERMSEGSDPVPPATFYGPRIDSIRNQLAGVEQGIADSAQGKVITPTQAHTLRMQAANISRTVERTAAANHGRLPAAQYQQIMHRFDNLDEQLLVDRGVAFGEGDGPNSNYPNG